MRPSRLFVLLFALALFASACAAGTPAATDGGPGSTAVPESEVADDPVEDVADEDHADDDHADDASADAEHADAEHADDGDHAGEDAHDEIVDHAEDHEDGDHDEAASADRVVDVILTEFAIEMSETQFSAGETVLFEVVNDGAIEHEFRLSNAHRIEEHIEGGHHDHDATSDTGHHEGGDVFVHLLAGEEGHLLVTFGDDTELFTEAACLVPGHYEAEMKADIVVTG